MSVLESSSGNNRTVLNLSIDEYGNIQQSVAVVYPRLGKYVDAINGFEPTISALTDEELRVLHAALHAYLDDFGHEEADLLRQIKALLSKLPTASS